MLKKLCFLFFIAQCVNAVYSPYISIPGRIDDRGVFITAKGESVQLERPELFGEHLGKQLSPFFSNSDYLIYIITYCHIGGDKKIKDFILNYKAENGDFDALSECLDDLMTLINVFPSVNMNEDAADVLAKTYLKFYNKEGSECIVDISHTLNVYHSLRYSRHNGNFHKVQEIFLTGLRRFNELNDDCWLIYSAEYSKWFLDRFGYYPSQTVYPAEAPYIYHNEKFRKGVSLLYKLEQMEAMESSE